MSDTVQQVKERLDVADFIKQYVALIPAGRSLKGLCPFHKEKTPSFIVTPDRQIWHCFGCGAGGDVIAFLMRYENLEFIEALKILAERAGVDFQRSASPDQRQVNDLYEANKTAKEFFQETLRSAQSDKVKEYLKSRGLKGETAKEFEVGFALDAPDALTRHLTGLGFSVAAIEKAGLAIKTDRGTYRDRFWNRIMFPLHNAFGKCVGFTGRIVPWADKEGIGKYVNSPETPIFNKSKLLYGLDKTKKAIHDTRTAVLVEGQMDLIMAWQDGVKNIIATSGTAFTPDHLRSLRRLADNLVLIFDQDEPGQIATERTIDLAGAADFNVRVAKFSVDLAAKDPADIAFAKPGLLAVIIGDAESAMNFYFGRYHTAGRSGDWKKNIRAVLSKIKVLASSVERAHWLGELSARSGIDREHLVEEMDNLKDKGSSPIISGADSPLATEFVGGGLSENYSRKDIISQHIAILVLNHPSLYSSSSPLFADLPEDYRKIIENNSGNKSVRLDEKLQLAADRLALLSGAGPILEASRAEEELIKLSRRLNLEGRKNRRRELRDQIEDVERRGGEPSVELLSELNKLTAEIRDLDGK